MLPKDNTLIGQMLVSEGVISPVQLEAGLSRQKETKDFICSTLVKLGISTEEKIFSALSRQIGTPYIKLKDKEIDPAVIKKVSAKISSHYKIIPVAFQDNSLVIATSDPRDIAVLDDIKLLLGVEVTAVLRPVQKLYAFFQNKGNRYLLRQRFDFSSENFSDVFRMTVISNFIAVKTKFSRLKFHYL